LDREQRPTTRGNQTSALMLFVYAAAFSFAYRNLTTATDALIGSRRAFPKYIHPGKPGKLPL